MLYEGALLYAMLQTIPEATDREVLGYDTAQMQWAIDNEAQIWRELASRGYLYSVDPMVIDRLIVPAPSTSILTPDSPGRIGRFTGLRIVESYMADNPETDLGFLLSKKFYGDPGSLLKAAYSPKK